MPIARARYRSTRDDDSARREKLRELANQRRWFGFRRLHILFADSSDDSLAYGLATGIARMAILRLQGEPGAFAEMARQNSA